MEIEPLSPQDLRRKRLKEISVVFCVFTIAKSVSQSFRRKKNRHVRKNAAFRR